MLVRVGHVGIVDGRVLVTEEEPMGVLARRECLCVTDIGVLFTEAEPIGVLVCGGV